MSVDEVVWQAISGDWQGLLDAARYRVSEERWAPHRARLERPELLLAEREGKMPVKRIRAEKPADLLGAVRYGIDQKSSIVVADRFIGPGSPRLASTYVWVNVRGVSVLIAVSAADHEFPASLVRVIQPRFDDGVLAAVDARHLGRPMVDSRESYAYDDSARLLRISVHENWEGKPSETVYDVTYDADGAVALITANTRSSEGSTRRDVAYRRPSSAAVKAAATTVSNSLPELVAAWVGRVAPPRPIVALALVYSREIPGLPPALALATEADRARLAASPIGAGEPVEVWNPAEWSVFDAEPQEFVSDEELMAACRALLEHWRITRARDSLRRTLVDAAKRLAASDWERLTLPLGQLVTYAIDDEGEDLERNLKASVNPRLRRRMVEPG